MPSFELQVVRDKCKALKTASAIPVAYLRVELGAIGAFIAAEDNLCSFRKIPHFNSEIDTAVMKQVEKH